MQSDRIQLWIVNQYALAPDQAGGTRHYMLAHYLQQQGIETTILASSRDYLTQKEQRLDPGEQSRVVLEKDVRYVWLRTPKYQGNGLGRVKNMLAFVKAVIGWKPGGNFARPDIIIGSSPHLFSALAAYLLAKRYRVPFVLEIRDIWPKSMTQILGVYPYHPFILLLAAVERFLYQKADLILGVLQGVGGHAARTIGRQVPFMWLPNGVNLADYPKLSNSTEENGKFSVLYTGAHGVPNSLDTALEAAKLLQQEGHRIHFTFVGEGGSKEDLIRKAKSDKLTNVTFLPSVPKTRIPTVLSQADALLILQRNTPLYKDGLSPNKLFDYFAASKPIVITLDSPFDPVRDSGAGLTVPPENPRALADALIQLSGLSVREREALGKRGREYVEEHHDMKRLALRLGNALRALL